MTIGACLQFRLFFNSKDPRGGPAWRPGYGFPRKVENALRKPDLGGGVLHRAGWVGEPSPYLGSLKKKSPWALSGRLAHSPPLRQQHWVPWGGGAGRGTAGQHHSPRPGPPPYVPEKGGRVCGGFWGLPCRGLPNNLFCLLCKLFCVFVWQVVCLFVSCAKQTIFAPPPPQLSKARGIKPFLNITLPVCLRFRKVLSLMHPLCEKPGVGQRACRERNAKIRFFHGLWFYLLTHFQSLLGNSTFWSRFWG